MLFFFTIRNLFLFSDLCPQVMSIYEHLTVDAWINIGILCERKHTVFLSESVIHSLKSCFLTPLETWTNIRLMLLHITTYCFFFLKKILFLDGLRFPIFGYWLFSPSAHCLCNLYAWDLRRRSQGVLEAHPLRFWL